MGKLLKPGEAPTNYSDEEEEGSQQEQQETKSDETPKSKDDWPLEMAFTVKYHKENTTHILLKFFFQNYCLNNTFLMF